MSSARAVTRCGPTVCRRFVNRNLVHERLLIAHYDRRHLDTIRKLVEMWAPPNEKCLSPILTAMIKVENGRQPYTDAQIDAALVRAGVVPPQRSLQETRTVKGGQVAAAGTIGAGAIGAIQETVGQAHEALVGVVPYLDAAKWGLLAVTLIGIGVMLWARIDDRRKGLR